MRLETSFRESNPNEKKWLLPAKLFVAVVNYGLSIFMVTISVRVLALMSNPQSSEYFGWSWWNGVVSILLILASMLMMLFQSLALFGKKESRRILVACLALYGLILLAEVVSVFRVMGAQSFDSVAFVQFVLLSAWTAANHVFWSRAFAST